MSVSVKLTLIICFDYSIANYPARGTFKLRILNFEQLSTILISNYLLTN